jgi:hypothetical protein
VLRGQIRLAPLALCAHDVDVLPFPCRPVPSGSGRLAVVNV